jgi:hypothetical protein
MRAHAGESRVQQRRIHVITGETAMSSAKVPSMAGVMSKSISIGPAWLDMGNQNDWQTGQIRSTRLHRSTRIRDTREWNVRERVACAVGKMLTA